MESHQYYVYIATNFTHTVLYIGVTNNLIRRMYEHKEKFVSSFTAKYHINKLVYFEIYANINTAIAREKQLKAGSRKKKVDLILASNPLYEDLYNKLV